MNWKYKILLSIIVILIIIVIGFLCISHISKRNSKESTDKDVEVKVLESIEKYGYSLHERDSKIMKETYEELKDILNEEDINYDEYAKNVAKLFSIDLWTMNNKTNKYDVGGVEYIYPDNVNNFKLNVENTIYKMIENNINGTRKQDLPAVNSIINCDLENGEYTIGDNKMNSFIVSLEWDYDIELGYETKATITMVKKDNKLYIVEYVPGE